MLKVSSVRVETVTLNKGLVAADVSPQTMQENDPRVSTGQEMLPLLSQRFTFGTIIVILYSGRKMTFAPFSPVYFPQEGCTLSLPFPYVTRKPTSSLDGLKISESKEH